MLGRLLGLVLGLSLSLAALGQGTVTFDLSAYSGGWWQLDFADGDYNRLVSVDASGVLQDAYGGAHVSGNLVTLPASDFTAGYFTYGDVQTLANGGDFNWFDASSITAAGAFQLGADDGSGFANLSTVSAPEPGAGSFFLLGLALMCFKRLKGFTSASPGISTLPFSGSSALVPSYSLSVGSAKR